jgi:hypothetical protein
MPVIGVGLVTGIAQDWRCRHGRAQVCTPKQCLRFSRPHQYRSLFEAGSILRSPPFSDSRE